MSHIIIGIHGLSNKPDKDVLAKWWESSLLEGLSKNEKLDNLSLTFTSVYWADVMYPEFDTDPDKYKEAKEGAIKTYHDGWRDTLRKNFSDFGSNLLDSIKNHFGIDAVADEVLRHKLKDLSRYYEVKKDRDVLRGRLEKRILEHQNSRIMVLAHSMGSIIAYDVLRALGRKQPRLVIDHFVTIGSPLGLPHVKYKISEESAVVRTPSIVKNWTNFADRRDPVAIDTHLAGDYEPNMSGVQVKDDLICNDWGGINHKSYGYLRCPEVSKVIKNFI